MSELPNELIEEVRAGNCIAFVGAGFAGAAGFPTWAKLLQGLASRQEVPSEVRQHIEELMEKGSSHAYDEAAQTLEWLLTRKTFVEELQHQFTAPTHISQGMSNRLRWLRAIPFRAILTTNFDTLLEGDTPGNSAYRSVLRPKAAAWWEGTFWGETPYKAPILKIHGDVRKPETIVLTRRDYRHLLYRHPGYQDFLRAVLSHHTVLYLGFSFTDAYLNELRSETLALLGYDSKDSPAMAFAIANDVPPATRRHFKEHEGIHMLSYQTRTDDSKPADHSGFDRLLEDLHDKTNPVFQFGRLLGNKRLLWVDPNPGHNAAVARFFSAAKEIAHVRLGSLEIEPVSNAVDGLSLLQKAQAAGKAFDIVITHWGHEPSTAEHLLQGMRREDLRSPVIVFSTKTEADARKKKALSLGAQAYCYEYDALLRALDHVLSPAWTTRQG
jgi:hypothetical protein